MNIMNTKSLFTFTLVLPLAAAASQTALAQTGWVPPRQLAGPHPVRTIDALSLPAADDAPAMPLRVYRLGPQSPAPEELIGVIRELVAPGSWDDEGVYLRSFQMRLIIRHRADVHRRIQRLLVELRAIVMPIGGSSYRGHPFSPIPVVGQSAPGDVRR